MWENNIFIITVEEFVTILVTFVVKIVRTEFHGCAAMRVCPVVFAFSA